MLRRYASWALPAGLASACVLPNPAYDLDGGGTALTSTATQGPPTTSTSGASTSAGSVSSSGEATTTASTGDLSVSSSGDVTSSSSTGDPTTGDPLDCWGDPSPWEVSALAINDIAPGGHAFRIAPDGLSMVYMAGLEGDRYPRLASRAALDQPFTFVQQLAAWPNLGSAVDHASIVGAAELFLSGGVDVLDGADLWVSRLQGDVWTVPLAVGSMVNVQMKNDRAPTLSEDGRVLVFERNDGPANPYFNNAPALRLFESTRPQGGDPLTEFSAPIAAAIPEITADPYPHLMSCPALSPDGLHLFFGSTYPKILDAQTIIGASSTYQVDRPTRQSPWGPLTHHDVLQAPELHTCPHSITRDGCTLIFSRFWYSKEMPEGEPESFWVATRTP
ncbi:MAG: PD40 domain-containing protein [Myxococcales bacterium]|nr:PD40 domain-containing protein [Myxococcales bacterium]